MNVEDLFSSSVVAASATTIEEHVLVHQQMHDPTRGDVARTRRSDNEWSTCKVFFVSCPHVRCHVEMLSQQKAKHDVFLRVIKNIPINIATPTAWKPTDVFMCGAWHHHVRFSSSPVLEQLLHRIASSPAAAKAAHMLLCPTRIAPDVWQNLFNVISRQTQSMEFHMLSNLPVRTCRT